MGNRPRAVLFAALAVLVLFAGYGIHLSLGGTMLQGMDDAWRAFIGSDLLPSGPLVWFFEQFGYGLGYTLLGLTLGGLAIARRWWQCAFVACAAVLGPGLLSQLTKRLVDRDRPALDPSGGGFGPWTPVDDWSYPSGHSVAMGMAVTAVWVVLPKLWRAWWLPVAVLLCAGMVWQRTLMNAHWLSDTLFGVAGGVAVSLLVWWWWYPSLEPQAASERA